jgi:FHS family L-fucose permease-like MFS transporter
MPAFTGSGFEMVKVPLSALLLVLCGLCTSVMWGTIFDLAVEGLGASTNKASGIFMAMVVGGGILPLIQGGVADATGENYLLSYVVILIAVIYIVWYALMGSKPAKTE